ncbi:hypothetical protein LJC32_02025 [Oscillospiraceae bacterium OttesenSCG-928-F05]|nr:hypothetical protein [Oscillospiraceae bacterium OttesenSCG-928-F05]
MKRIGELLLTDLSYIWGERESGPNGAKKEFLDKSAVFLRALAKDMCFAHSKVAKNSAGIAVSGEVSLYGYWSEGNGLYFELSEPVFGNRLLYRTVDTQKRHGSNQWLPIGTFIDGEYQELLDTLLRLKAAGSEVRNAA